MENNKITWFDFSAYGHKLPVAVDQQTLKRVMFQAEELMKHDYVSKDSFYVHGMFNYLKELSQFDDDAEWRLMVLLHIALCGLKGIAPPPIIFDFE